jgi:hypothetical protein
MDIVHQFEAFLKRTEPGPGKDADDDGVPGSAHLAMAPCSTCDGDKTVRRPNPDDRFYVTEPCPTCEGDE